MGRVSRYQAPSIHHVVASPYLGGRFVWPCLPTKTHEPPSGGLWIHEIKHDGFRIIARKNGERVPLYSRPGNDRTDRFPRIVEALEGLRSQSCIIDGEAVVCDDNGVASFDRIRHRHHDSDAFLYAFDLIELNGDDLRRDPLQLRKATLAHLSWPRTFEGQRSIFFQPPHEEPWERSMRAHNPDGYTVEFAEGRRGHRGVT
jgi:ATP-dependent DNA ligase